MPLAQLHRGAPTSTAEFFSQLFGRGDDGPETTLICHFTLLFCWIGSLCSLLDHVENALSIEAWSTNFCQQSVYECQCSQAPPAFLTLSTFSRPQWWLARRVREVRFCAFLSWNDTFSSFVASKLFKVFLLGTAIRGQKILKTSFHDVPFWAVKSGKRMCKTSISKVGKILVKW